MVGVAQCPCAAEAALPRAAIKQPVANSAQLSASARSRARGSWAAELVRRLEGAA